LAALLLSRFRLSRRDLVLLLSDVLDVPAPALGTTQSFANEASKALLPTYREVRRAVRGSQGVRVDETGWKLRGQSRWTWAAAAERATLFQIGRSRGARELERLLGSDYGGVVTSDRWSAYKICTRRQICWAHLHRDFEKLGLRGEEARGFAERGSAECVRLFRLWHGWKRTEQPRSELARRLWRRCVPAWHACSHAAQAGRDPKVAAVCRNLQGLWAHLWTFTHEPVEPTNNQAERALRRAVLWRRTSFGSASGRGMRFVERMLTLSETCRQHRANILDYLTRAIVAHRQNAPAPRLLQST
jgi:transposase